MMQYFRILPIILITGCSACTAMNQPRFAIRPVGEVTAAGTVATGDALMAKGEYALAIDAYRKAVFDDPSNAQGYNGMAIAYASIGRYDLSGRFFELALARAPSDAKIYRNLAHSLDQQGEHEEALAVQRNMKDALRLADATISSPPPAVAFEVRPSLAELAGVGARPTSVSEVQAEPQNGPHLIRKSLGEVALVTLPSRPIAVPAARVAEHVTKTSAYDSKFARLWANWPNPHAVTVAAKNRKDSNT